MEKKQLKYLQCSHGDLHQGEYLNIVCVDQDCKIGQGLICSICRQEKHQKHQVMPLKMFISLVQTNVSQINTVQNNKVDEILNEIDVLQGQIIFSLKESVEKMATRIKQLEECLVTSYKKVKDAVITQSFLSESIPTLIQNIMNGEYEDAASLKKEFVKLIQSVKITDKNKLQLDFSTKNFMFAFQQTQEEFLNLMPKIASEFSDSMKRAENVLKQASCTYSDEGFYLKQKGIFIVPNCDVCDGVLSNVEVTEYNCGVCKHKYLNKQSLKTLTYQCKKCNFSLCSICVQEKNELITYEDYQKGCYKKNPAYKIPECEECKAQLMVHYENGYAIHGWSCDDQNCKKTYFGPIFLCKQHDKGYCINSLTKIQQK